MEPVVLTAVKQTSMDRDGCNQIRLVSGLNANAIAFRLGYTQLKKPARGLYFVAFPQMWSITGPTKKFVDILNRYLEFK